MNIEEYAEDVVKLVKTLSLKYYLTTQQAIDCVRIACDLMSIQEGGDDS